MDQDEKKRAGQVLGGLLDRQQQMGSDDPFSMMKQLTQTFQQPSGPITANVSKNFSYRPAPPTTTGNLTTYNAFTKQVISTADMVGPVG